MVGVEVYTYYERAKYWELLLSSLTLVISSRSSTAP